MSNKTTIQSYNTRLSDNNNELRKILTSIESLPEIQEPTLQDKLVEITTNGITNIVADEGFDGIGNVEINTNIPSGIVPNEKAIYFDNWNKDGYPTKAVISGWTGTQIPSYLFRYQGSSYSPLCRYLEEVDIQQTGKNCLIMEYCFGGLTNLKKVNLPSTVTELRGATFYNCTALEEIDISNITLVQNSFSGCTALKNIIFNTTKGWGTGGSAFRYVPIEEFISNTCNNIAYYCFDSCTKLKKVNVSSPSVSSGNNLAYNAFSNCTSLVSASFENLFLNSSSVSSDSKGQFYNCTALKAVWLGSRISYAPITRYAFSACTAIQKLYINLPRATVEAWTNYQYAFSNNAFTTDVIICSDDEGFITKEEFDAIDWSTYTG